MQAKQRKEEEEKAAIELKRQTILKDHREKEAEKKFRSLQLTKLVCFLLHLLFIEKINLTF